MEEKKEEASRMHKLSNAILPDLGIYILSLEKYNKGLIISKLMEEKKEEASRMHKLSNAILPDLGIYILNLVSH